MSSEDKPDVRASRHGAVALIEIDCGEVNAVRPKTMRDLCAELETARDDPAIRAVVLGHAGRHFVAGADLDFLQSLKEASPQAIKSDIYQTFQGAMKLLYAFPKPTVAAIGGAAITVGCEAALACDFRVVTQRASFQESWIRLGLMPPLGGLKMLPALIGFGRAADMVLRGRSVGGEEAVAIGLAHELVAQDQLQIRALALASELAESAPLAFQAAKEGLRRALESGLEETFAANVSSQALLILSQDFREGVDAAAGRRKPNFKGM